MDDLRSYPLSAPITTVTPMQQLRPYRSFREERRGKITKKPEIDAIPEGEIETVEERFGKPKISSRPSSSGSLRKDKIDIYERVTHYNKSDKDLHLQSHVNHGFIGNNQQLHRSTSTLHSTHVVREQYCSCCRGWSRREKVLLLAIACLVGIVCGLFVAVGVLIDRQNGNHTMLFTFRL